MIIPTKKVCKLLVHASRRHDVIYELGQYKIYTETIKLLKSSKNHNSQHGLYLIKGITDEDANIAEFMMNTNMKAVRLFKSALMPKKGLPKGFMMATSKNLCGMMSGKTIKIQSKSIGIRSVFYTLMSKVNDECKFKCKFDYDKFDVTFGIKRLKLNNGRTMLFTYFYNKQYPNVSLV